HWEAQDATSYGWEPGKLSVWKDLGDCTDGPTPTPTVTPTPTTPPTTPPDGPTLGGYVEIGSKRYEYTTVSTGNGPGIYDPLQINTTRQVTRQAVTGGFRYTDQRTTYDTYGLPTKINDYGDTGTASDNTCVTMSYARNIDSGQWILALPSTVETRKGDDCVAGDVIGRVVTLYDGGTDPATNKPTRGNKTEIRTWLDATHIATEKSVFDGYGRPTSTTDVRGKTTSISYAPTVGYPVDGTTRTNPLGFTQTAWNAPAHGGVVALRDPNDRTTNIEYDSLGRTTTLWTPGQPKSGSTPAAKVSYSVPFDGGTGQPTASASVTMSKIFSGAGSSAKWLTSVSFEDGLGRLREEQMPSPAGGRMVKITAYDARGLETVRSAPLHNSANAGAGLLNPAMADVPSWARTIFDGAGREVAKIQYGGVVEVRRASTAYAGADQYTVTPPLGGKTTYTVNAAGKVTGISEQFGTQWLNSTREYDALGNLTRMTDANGNVRTFTYDWAKRRVAQTDPDFGATAAAYDPAGNLTSATDAKGGTISTVYDDLGRKKEQWVGNPGSGTKVAEWVYDTLFKGERTSATRWTGGQAYTDTVTDYDADYRPLGSVLTIPAAEGLLARTYTFTVGYDKAGRENSKTFPEAGGLPEETTATTFNDVGLPVALSSDFGGTFTYVKTTGYSPVGKLTSRDLGNSASIRRTLTWDPATNALTSVKTVSSVGNTPSATVQEDQFSYDAAGSLASIADNTVTPAPQLECFGYDVRRRLESAFSTTGACTGGPVAGGPDPYSLSYTYDPVGNIKSVTDSGHTATYDYPAPGAGVVRPNAVRSITRASGTDTYTYDARGQLTSQLVGGTTSTFDWNELGQMAKATVGGRISDEVYDADGKRLIRREPGRTVLYLGAMELELADGKVTGKRYYQTQDGVVVAMRTSGRTGVTWLLAGPQGSHEFAIDETTGKVDRQKYLPFGARRAGRDALPGTDQGFLGKTEDEATGLVDLGARYYSPAIARFISTDPLLAGDPSEQQFANPYSYAGNDPIRLADPTGLFPESPTVALCRSHDLLCSHDSYNQAVEAAELAELQQERQDSSQLLAELSVNESTERGSAKKSGPRLKECDGLSDKICNIVVYVSLKAFELSGSRYSKSDKCSNEKPCKKNAMRHCVQQVALTDICGRKIAEQVAENHEKGNDMSKRNVRKDTAIDRHNNKVSQEAAEANLGKLRSLRYGEGSRADKAEKYWAYVKELCETLWTSGKLW
ncbi:RHS repeat-associated core domain-containing protein, partial [Sphaerisporangium sp. NPDC051017]|uniref:RHS repeat domain-containing protein n=1 Tax=Sphaerisporangium sp. NPDC051017 TaxID=3154636 RepID=UPI0034253253